MDACYLLNTGNVMHFVLLYRHPLDDWRMTVETSALYDAL